MAANNTLPDIRVFNANFEMIDSISAEVYQYWRYERHLRTADNFEFKINKNHPKSQSILNGDALMLVYYDGTTARAGIIEQVQCSMSETGSSDEVVTVTGRSGGSFEHRLAVAGTAIGTGYDTQTGAAETLLRHYVDVNCINALDGAGDAASARVIPQLTLSDTDGERGVTCTYSARYETIAEILETICNASGLGWEVDFDRDSATFVFDVISGTDRSEQSVNPIIFKLELNNLKTIDYQSSQIDTKTLAYVGGSGEDASRIVQEVYLTDDEPTGFARHETFVSASNTDDVGELVTVGESELHERSGELSLSAEIDLNFAAQQYLRDYDLGDIVTVQYTGVASVDVRIIGIIDEIVGGGRGDPRTITAKLGTEPVDITRIVKRTTRKTIEQLK